MDDCRLKIMNMDKKNFDERCYFLLRKIPRGKVTTYKALADNLNSRAYRAVGQAMKNNPYAPEVPCHRVICSDGSIGGFSGGVLKKINLLKEEGVEIINEKIDLKKFEFNFE